LGAELPQSKEYTILRGARGLRLYLANEYLFLLDQGITEPEKFVREKSDRVIDDVSNTKISSVALKGLRLAAKEYLPRKGAKAFKDFFRRSKPVREFLFSLRLAGRGIPCPRPVCAAQRRGFRRVAYCALFAQEIEDATSLHQLIKSSRISQLSPEKMTGLSYALAESIAKIHDKGFLHRDLNPSHILITAVDTLSPSFHYVDFENSKLLRSSVPPALRARELSRLCRSVSKTAPGWLALRFLVHYARKSNLSARTLFEKLRAINKKNLESANL
jgi:serine/threonine protein kinase